MTVDNYEKNLVLFYVCSEGIDASKIDKYMYIYQRVGFNLNYRYRLGTNGVRSRGFQKYMEDNLAEGLIVVSRDRLFCTSLGLSIFENSIVSLEEDIKLKEVRTELDSLSTSELDLLLVVDLLVSDIQKTKGAQGLVDERESIEKTAERLCTAYSPSNFNKMVGFISRLERRLS